MAAAVLVAAASHPREPGSFNNEVGVPMTLLGAPPGTEVVVAELGARRKGDVAMLCEIARPGIVVVTNVGVAHLEIFGSWEAIVEASAEPVDAAAARRVAVLNADDPVVAGYRLAMRRPRDDVRRCMREADVRAPRRRHRRRRHGVVRRSWPTASGRP